MLTTLKNIWEGRGNKIVILMYHGVVVDNGGLRDWCMLGKSVFEDQISHLANNYNVTSLSSAVNMLRDNNITDSVVITFDDGYSNNYEHAYPILKKYNVPATIFLSTGYLDTTNTIWTGQLSRMIRDTSVSSIKWRGNTYSLSSNQEKELYLENVKRYIKKRPYQELLDVIKMHADKLKVIENITSPDNYSILTSSQILEMKASGLIELGAHTVHHPILSRMSVQNQKEEIQQSITRLSEIAGECSFFAYPNGNKDDYTHDTVKLLRNTAIKASLTTRLGTCRYGDSLFELKRIGIGNDMYQPRFEAMLKKYIRH